MAKQVLGRNLEALLDDKSKGEAAAPAKTPAGSGVRSLMRGNQPVLSRPLAPPPAPVRAPVVPRWYLFAGDLLLGLLALIIVCKSPHPMPWPRVAFCAVVVALGAVFALFAVWLGED